MKINIHAPILIATAIVLLGGIFYIQDARWRWEGPVTILFVFSLLLILNVAVHFGYINFPKHLFYFFIVVTAVILTIILSRLSTPICDAKYGVGYDCVDQRGHAFSVFFGLISLSLLVFVTWIPASFYLVRRRYSHWNVGKLLIATNIFYWATTLTVFGVAVLLPVILSSGLRGVSELFSILLK